MNENYYGYAHPTNNSKFIGSWGKLTRVRPPRDVDLVFELPYSVYQRFEQRTGNKQSQLLQEVRSVATSQIFAEGPFWWAKVGAAIFSLLAGFFPAIYVALGMTCVLPKLQTPHRNSQI